ncbi:MAG: YutD family protein [Bacilli bacterium]|nr:YutD family protein [Bacilli bacterium]
MKKIVEMEDKNKYEIITDYREGFVKEEFINRYTDYFKDFDYIVGDWSYGKLRLKGFYDDNNEKASKINKYSLLDKYLEENCAYGCKYFVAKRVIV